MIDINTSLIIIVIIVFIMFVAVMMFPVNDDVEHDNDKIEHTEQNITGNYHDEFEDEEEDQYHNNIEHFVDENNVPLLGLNNDVATVLPVKLDGELYNSQNNEAKNDIPNEPLVHVIDKRTFHDVVMNDHQFQTPIPYTAQNINAFYDFLGSTFDKINFKYRVNSEGPLI